MYLKNLITSFPVAKYKFIIQPKEDTVFSKLSFYLLSFNRKSRLKNFYIIIANAKNS